MKKTIKVMVKHPWWHRPFEFILATISEEDVEAIDGGTYPIVRERTTYCCGLGDCPFNKKIVLTWIDG